MKVRFTQTSMYKLSCLNNRLRREDGTRYRLTEEEDVIELLQHASKSDVPKIKVFYKSLLDHLWEEEREKLLALMEETSEMSL